MSKSIKEIAAKSRKQKKESDKVTRKLGKTLEMKMNRERQLDPYYDMRRKQQQALLDRMMARPRTNNGIYGPY